MNPHAIRRFVNGALIFAISAAVLILISLPNAPLKAQQQGQMFCSQKMQYDDTANGSTRIFTANASSSARVFFCDFIINVGAVATNVQLRSGTGTNCGSNTVNLTPLFVLPAAGQVYVGGGVFQGLATDAARDVCVFTSAGNPVQVVAFYTYQN